MNALVVQKLSWVIVCKASIIYSLVFSTSLLIPDREERDHAPPSIQHSGNTEEILTEGRMEGGAGRYNELPSNHVSHNEIQGGTGFKSEYSQDWQFRVRRLRLKGVILVNYCWVTNLPPNLRLTTTILLYLTVLWVGNLDRVWLGDPVPCGIKRGPSVVPSRQLGWLERANSVLLPAWCLGGSDRTAGLSCGCPPGASTCGLSSMTASAWTGFLRGSSGL